MELLDRDIHFPMDDILVPYLQAISTPIRKLAIRRRCLRTQGWIELNAAKAEGCRRSVAA